MESGYGSALPTPVIAHLSNTGAAARSGQLNVGDHIIAVNGINMVGMPVISVHRTAQGQSAVYYCTLCVRYCG